MTPVSSTRGVKFRSRTQPILPAREDNGTERERNACVGSCALAYLYLNSGDLGAQRLQVFEPAAGLWLAPGSAKALPPPAGTSSPGI